MAMIPLAEYARRNGRLPDVARHMAHRGSFRTATRLGRDWIVDEYEPWPDRRVKAQKKGVGGQQLEKIEKFVVVCKCCDNDGLIVRLMTHRELANDMLLSEQLAGVYRDYVVYRIIRDRDPVRLTVKEDFGSGWMSITLLDGDEDLGTVTLDRP